MSLNDFSLPAKELFEGPMKWYGVHDNRLAVLNPVQRQAELTDTWEDVLYSGALQSPREFRAFSLCLSMLVPTELSAAATPNPDIAKVRDIIIRLDGDVNPSQFFGRVALARGRIQPSRQESMRWAMVGVAQRIAVGAFVERLWSPSLGHEEGRPGITQMHIRPLLCDEANMMTELMPTKKE